MFRHVSQVKIPSDDILKDRVKELSVFLQSSIRLRLHEENLINSRTPLISITLDCWSSIASEGYVTVTAHALTRRFERINLCLGCIYLPEGDKAEEDLVPIVTEVLQSYGINVMHKAERSELRCGDLLMGTTDAGGADKKVSQAICEQQHLCADHQLNTGLKKACNLKRLQVPFKKIDHLVAGASNTRLAFYMCVHFLIVVYRHEPIQSNE
jgi:hypothetical protein